MRSGIQSYWNYGTTFCSTEIASVSGEEKLFAVTAKKKKDEFKELDFIESSSFSELSTKLPKHQHAYLIVNTNKVLLKETSFESNNKKVLSRAFPGLALSDFYYEILRTPAKCFIAVCRKDYIDAILKEAELQKIAIIGFSLGFSSISNLVPIIDEDEIYTSRHQFYIQNTSIASFSEKTGSGHTYTIEDIHVSSNHLLALSGLFNYIKNEERLTNFNKENKHLKELQGQKAFFKKGLAAGIGILLVLLLINFLFFSSYYNRQQVLSQEVQLLQAQKETFAARINEIEAKEQVVTNILTSGNSKSSFYLNRIVAERPASILFSAIQFQPLGRAIRPDKKIEYEAGKITVAGESNDRTAFSKWIETLEQKDWIKAVTVISYGATNSRVAEFEISIHIKNDAEE